MSAVSARLPVTQNPDNSSDITRSMPICNPDGSFVGGASSPAAPSTAGTPYDARIYGSIEAQVSGLSGGDTIAFTTSNDGANYVPVNWVDRTLATGAVSPFSITANQIYAFPGGGYLKWAQTGSASTPTVTVRAAS